MPPTDTKFNPKYKKDYPFLTGDPSNEFNGTCVTCRVSFSIKTGGRSSISQHVNTKRHINATKAVTNCAPLDNFFKTTLSSEAELTAARELGFTYHVAKHAISFNSTECSSQLFQSMFDKNFRCSSKKTAALVTNVIAPIITANVKEDIQGMSFITLMCDASNRQDTKLLPVLMRGYIPGKGIVIYKLTIEKIDNERAVTIRDVLVKTAADWNITQKVIAFGSDNCNTNFGGIERNGENNVFALLKKSLGRDVFGLGCLFHIVGNSVEAAASVLPHDIGAIIEKMFQHLHIHAVRTATLQTICAEAGITYRKLTHHSNVRYLTLLSSIQRITPMFAALQDFFLNHTPDCPTILSMFFTTDYGLFWLLFLEELTTAYILRMEAKEPASFEVASLAEELLDKLRDRKSESFISFKALPEFNKLSEARQYRVKQFLTKFYNTQIDYLSRWLSSSDGTQIFSWCSLRRTLEWNEISTSLNFIFEKVGMHPFEIINRDGIFDEIKPFKTFVQNSLEKWSQDATSIQRWKELFQYGHQNGLAVKNLELLVELVMCLPGTNAQNERLFSIIFDTWSSDKGQCSGKTVDALTTIKFNSSMTCSEFYDKIKGDRSALRKVVSSEKYLN